MKQILTSIHDSNTLGLAHDSSVIARQGLHVGGGKGGSVYGQMPVPSPRHIVDFEDFLRDFDSTSNWLVTVGNASGTPTAARLAGGMGGVLRMTTGNDGTLAADSVQMTKRVRMLQASNGGLTFETRIKISAITQAYIFVGLTDTVAAALEAPIISAASANTLTTNATDAVGWMFDTRMSTDKWWLTGVAGDTDATAQNSGYAPVADTYEILRIALDTRGNATFYRNGVKVGTIMSGALTASADLTPVITVATTTGTTAKTLDIDYIMCAMDRA